MTSLLPYSILFNLVCLTTVLFLICLFLNYLNSSRIQKVDGQNAMAKAYLNGLIAIKNDMLTNGKGKAGENRLADVVYQTLNEIGVDFKTNQDVGIRDAVLLPQGTDPYSKEIDLLLVTAYGIYLFEAKDWSGRWSNVTCDSDKLTLTSPNGQVDVRSAPLKKTVGKLQAIKNAIPIEPNTHALVICTHSNGSIDPNLSSKYMTLNDLAYFLRSERDNRIPIADIETLQSQVFGQLDRSPDALHHHMMRLSPNNENVKLYQENHHAIGAAQVRQQIVYPKKIKTKGWLVAFFGSLVVSSLVFAYAPKPAPVVAKQQDTQKVEKVSSKTKIVTAKKKNN